MFLKLLLGLFCMFALPRFLSAQLSYGYTTFIHGFNDDSARFTRPNTAGLLSGQVDLKIRQFPSLNGSLSIDSQAVRLFNRVSGDQQGPHVLVGHSMGGLTSRSAYFSHPAGPFSAIITMGTPHQGAPIADNATNVTGFIGDEVSDYFQTLVSIFYRPTPGNILSAASVAVIQLFAGNYLSNAVQQFLNKEFGTKSPGLNDVKTSSPTVARLNASNDPLPHANVLGTIGRRNAVFRVAFSEAYNDAGFEPFRHKKNKVKSIVKACRQVAWNFIVRLQVGRICNQMDNSLGSIDDRWAHWTMGPAAKRDPNATFDGLIPTARSRYPGTSLIDPTINFTAATVNHMNLQYNSGGINAVAQAMLQVGMDDPPPPPGTIGSVTISGPSQVEAGCTGTWVANAYGGVAPYTSVWTVEGNSYATESFSYTPTSAFTLQVTVTDSQGSTGSNSQYVSITSGNCS